MGGGNGVTKYGKNWHEEGIIEAINKIKKKQIRERKNVYLYIHKLLIYRCEVHYNRLSYSFCFRDIKF